MLKYIVTLIVGVVLTLAVISVVQGWIPSHADAAFLTVTGFSVLSYIAWLFLSPYFDNTNGNDTGSFCDLVIWIVAILAVIMTPMAAVAGVVWWHAAVIACGLVLLAEIIAGFQMHAKNE
jgi:hypothetical protein